MGIKGYKMGNKFEEKDEDDENYFDEELFLYGYNPNKKIEEYKEVESDQDIEEDLEDEETVLYEKELIEKSNKIKRYKISRKIPMKSGYETKKGHYVRSKNERFLANLFYDRGINYEYERWAIEFVDEKITTHPDFYIPEKKVYIEFFDDKYGKSKLRNTKKRECYLKYKNKIRCVFLNEDDTRTMDKLKFRLKKFGGIELWT